MELQTTEQVAQGLQMSPRTLEKMRTTGGGPRYAKLGRRTLYDVRDVMAWVEGQKRANTAGQGN